MSRDDDIYDDDDYYDEEEEDLDEDDEEVRSSRPSVNPFGSSSSGSLPGRDRFGNLGGGPSAGSGSSGSGGGPGQRPSPSSPAPFSRPSGGGTPSGGSGSGNFPARFGSGSSPSGGSGDRPGGDKPSSGSGLPGRDPKDAQADRARFFGSGSSGGGSPTERSSGDRPSGDKPSGLPGRDPKDAQADRARFFGSGSSGGGSPTERSSGDRPSGDKPSGGSGLPGRDPKDAQADRARFFGSGSSGGGSPTGGSGSSGGGSPRPFPGGAGEKPSGGSGSSGGSFGSRFGTPGSGGDAVKEKDAPKSSPPAQSPPKKEDDKAKPAGEGGGRLGGITSGLGGLAARSPFGGKKDGEAKPADKKDARPGDKKDAQAAPKAGGPAGALGGLASRLPIGGGAKKDDAPAKPADKKDAQAAPKAGGPAGGLGGLASRLPIGGGAKKDDAPAKPAGGKTEAQAAPKAGGPGGAFGGFASRLPGGGAKKEDAPGGGKDAPAKPAGTARTGDKPPEKAAEAGKASPLSRFRGGSGAANTPPAAGSAKGDARPKSATRAEGGGAAANLLSRVNVFSRPAPEKSTRTSKTRASKIPQTSSEGMSLDTQLDILGVGLVFGALVIAFSSLSGEQGAVTAAINGFFLELLGRGLFGVPVAMLALGVWLIVRHFGDEAPVIDPVRIGGIAMLYIGMLMVFQYLDSFRDVYIGVDIPTYRLLVEPLTTLPGLGGGRIGAELYVVLLSTVGDVASVFVILCWMTIGLMLATRTTAAEIAVFVISIYRSFVVAMQRRAQRAAAKRAEALLLAAQQAEAAKLLAAQQQAQIAVTRPAPESLPAPAVAAALPAPAEADAEPVPIEQRDIRIRVAGQMMSTPGSTPAQPAPAIPAPAPAPAVQPAASQPQPLPAASPTPAPATPAAASADSGGRFGGLAARLRGGAGGTAPVPKPEADPASAKDSGAMRFFRRTDTRPETPAAAGEAPAAAKPPVPALPAVPAAAAQSATPSAAQSTPPSAPAPAATDIPLEDRPSPFRPSPFSRTGQPAAAPQGLPGETPAPRPASPFDRPAAASMPAESAPPAARPSPFERASASLGAPPRPAEPARPAPFSPAPPEAAQAGADSGAGPKDEDLSKLPPAQPKGAGPVPRPQPTSTFAARFSAPQAASPDDADAADEMDAVDDAHEDGAVAASVDAPHVERLNRLSELRSGQLASASSGLRAMLDDDEDSDAPDDAAALDNDEDDDDEEKHLSPARSANPLGPRPSPLSPRPFTPSTPAAPDAPQATSPIQPAAAAAKPFSPFVSKPADDPTRDVTQRPAAYTPPSVVAGTPPTPTQVPPPERKIPQVIAPTPPAPAASAPAGPVINTAPAPQPPRQRRQWRLPDYRSLLASGSEQDFDRQLLVNKARVIEETLQSFGAPGRVVEINTGPVITQFGVEPDYLLVRGGKKNRVKVSAIAQLDKDLQLALGARSIRIEAPVPGKGYVGVEVPNDEASLVSLRDVMEAKQFNKIKSPLAIALGQSVDGTPVAADLASMPHLLIAGTTGSGKSVCVNSIISSLILQNTPDVVKFIMVDPKRVELTGYNGIPHLVAPVVVELERIVGVLKWVTREMDERYKKFSEAGARNIEDYNTHLAEQIDPMPYIVVIIDELADLMMLAPDETERVITRIAALARATGIHLVIATQRPSVDVVTGLIKANFPARIAFAVAGSVDSRVILDQPGAERLLGRGDMLYMSGDSPAPLRLQGVYVSDMEINNVTRFWRTQQPDSAAQKPITALVMDGPPQEARSVIPRGERFMQPPPASTQQAFWDDDRPSALTAAVSAAASASPSVSSMSGEGGVDDELYGEAVEMVRRLGKASVSLLQRRLRIGYTRAARLIDVMEAQGIIGPPTEGSKPREVLPVKK